MDCFLEVSLIFSLQNFIVAKTQFKDHSRFPGRIKVLSKTDVKATTLHELVLSFIKL